MKQKHGFRILLCLGVLALSLYTIWPTYRVLSQPQDIDKPIADQRRANFIKENPNVASKAMQLGLDLAGGTHIVVEVDNKGLTPEESEDVLNRSLEILRNRVDQYGLSEPIISKSGTNRVIAELAGLDAEAARRLIGSTALLEFKLLGEPEEFSSTLEQIDQYLKKQTGKAGNSDTAMKTDSTAQLKSIFGEVVTPKDTSSQKISGLGADTSKSDSNTIVSSTDSGKDSGLSAKEQAKLLEEIGSQPFSSYLVRSPGGGVGVRVENIFKLKKILNRPDVKNLMPKRYQFLWGKEEYEIEGGGKARELFFLKRRAEMTGEYVENAQVQRAPTGEVEVSLQFKGRGPKEFARITGANIQKRLAIVLDSVVYSAPTIQGKITQGQASITGIGDFEEAKLLATTLRAGSLPVPMQIVELRSVGPTMGQENIQKGLFAAILGFVLVVVFMVAYYLGSGLVSIVALVFNLVILMAVLSMAHATLTLPGIAGIILIIGMAVDANVIIFERIREELALGKTVRGAVDAGYKRAFTTIFDSNITTFGTALILYNIGSGPIKGFGLTLMIGIAASMFTALYVTRLIFDIYLDKVDVKSLSLGNGIKAFRNPKLSIIPRGKFFASISVAVIVITAILGITTHHYNWSIDFTGGHVYQVKFPNTPNTSQIKDQLSSAGVEGVNVRAIGVQSNNEILITTKQVGSDSLIHKKVASAIGQGQIVGEENVGPRIGTELMWDAILSLGLAMILIILYIWFRFGKEGLGFGLGAVVALIHDVVITFTLFGMLGLELDLTFVAAILTIVGYSLNDTIVVFDRVREIIGISGSDKFADKFNTAINQSFARTTITSGTTLLTVLALAIFGGEGLQSFSWALLFGIVVGTYSSSFIAAPFSVWWHNRVAFAKNLPKKEK